MSLYQKYRPQTLEQVKGNEDVILTLKGLLENKETFPHTILFSGQTGCGKTTMARIIASSLGCVGLDYRELNTADFRGIDTAREIIKSSQFTAMEGSVRVWVIDECHKLTGDAQNALLKILEDTPKHVFFVLCTTEPEKLISTVRGRCSQFQMLPLPDQQMFGLLRRVTREEGITLEKEVYDLIVQNALGHPRNALQILEQVLNVSDEQKIEVAKKVSAEQAQIIDLCRVLMKNGSSWSDVKKVLISIKDQEAESIRRVVLGYCQAILLNGENDKAAFIMEQFWEPTYNHGFPMIVYAAYSVIKTA
jgi:DNA polymerase-3 subunit gamma/tau